MSKLALYIDGIKAELFEDETITITQTIRNIRKLDTVFSNFSQDFTLPASSKKNQAIFKRYENINVIGGYDNRVKHSASLTINGALFKKGYIQINKVNLKNNKADSYSVRFVGGLSNLKSKLKENKLTALTVLDTEANSFSLSASSVKSLLKRDSAFTSTEVPNGFDLLASLITTEGGVFYHSTVHANDTPNAHYNGATDNGLYYKNIKPSIRLNAIIRAIETTYGIEFSNDFFKNDSIPEMNRLFMYLNKEKGEIKSSDETDSYLQSNYIFRNWSDSSGVNADSSTWSLAEGDNGIIYALPNPFPDFLSRAEVRITPEDTSLEYQVRIYKLDTGESLIDEWRTGEYTLNFGGDSLTGRIGFACGIEGDNNISLDIEYFINGVDNNFTLSGSAQSLEDIPYSIANNLPDMSVIDFLKGLFTLFNLVAYEDNEGVIVVEPLTDYLSAGTDIDISRYVDESSYSVDGSYQYSGVRLEYKESKDKNSLLLRNFQGKPYGAYLYSAVNIDTGGSEFSIKTPFTLLRYRKLTDNLDGSGTDIQIGEVVDENNNPITTSPIIYYPQKVDITFSYRTSVSTSEEFTGVNIPSNNLELYSADSDKTLTFGVEEDSYTRSRGFTGTLWDRYYNRFVSPLFNLRSRLINIDAFLPTTVILTATLRDRFVIKGIPYRINSIKTNLQTGKSSLELLTDSVFQNEEFSVATIGDAPVITILGSNPDTVNASGISYIDSGATATDTEDGALSVTTIQDLTDISSVGTYYVRYKAVDSDNNITIATRTVIVEDTTNPVIFTWAYDVKTSSTVRIDYSIEDSGSGLNKVVFQYKKAVDSDWITAKVTSFGDTKVNQTSEITYKGLDSSTSYDFRCLAYDSVLNETISSTVTQTTL